MYQTGSAALCDHTVATQNGTQQFCALNFARRAPELERTNCAALGMYLDALNLPIVKLMNFPGLFIFP